MSGIDIGSKVRILSAKGEWGHCLRQGSEAEVIALEIEHGKLVGFEVIGKHARCGSEYSQYVPIEEVELVTFERTSGEVNGFSKPKKVAAYALVHGEEILEFAHTRETARRRKAKLGGKRAGVEIAQLTVNKIIR